jgi:hypothetical protein
MRLSKSLDGLHTDHNQRHNRMCTGIIPHAILSGDSLQSSDFLLEPSPEDVRRICAMHQEQHGVAGLLCFEHDGLHAYPVEALPCCSSRAIQEMQKKNKMCVVVVVEAAVDYNTYFWHATCLWTSRN